MLSPSCQRSHSSLHSNGLLQVSTQRALGSWGGDLNASSVIARASLMAGSAGITGSRFRVSEALAFSRHVAHWGGLASASSLEPQVIQSSSLPGAP